MDMDHRKEAERSGWRHVRRRYSWLAMDELISCFFMGVHFFCVARDSIFVSEF